ncbi:MAG: hypothetical protein Q7S35_13785 [Candidatus Limnocylindrales bacterium]|nr:hypothetical protein [Candidatus Limnocylindrales bacterium]
MNTAGSGLPGDTFVIRGGAGDVGQVGSEVFLTSGLGGAATAGVAGGVSGALNLTSNLGGAGSAAQAAGASGAWVGGSGDAGANGGGGGAGTGNTTLDVGIPSGAGVAGLVLVGTNYAQGTTIGRATKTTTLNGTLAFGSTITANFGLFGPTSGAAAVPAFRALVAADIPDLSATYLSLATGGTLSGNTVLAADKMFGFGSRDPVAAPGALSPTRHWTTITSDGSAGSNAFTLADGTVNTTFKWITFSVETHASDTCVITPANFGSGTTITLAAKFDSVMLYWKGDSWMVIMLTGTATVA